MAAFVLLVGLLVTAGVILRASQSKVDREIARIVAAFDLDVPPGPYEVKVDEDTYGKPFVVIAGNFEFSLTENIPTARFRDRRPSPTWNPRTAKQPPVPARYTRAELEAKAERALRQMGYGPLFDGGMRVYRPEEDTERHSEQQRAFIRQYRGVGEIDYGLPPRDGWSISWSGPRLRLSTQDGEFREGFIRLDPRLPQLESIANVVSVEEAAATALRELRRVVREKDMPPPSRWPSAEELARGVRRSLGLPFGGGLGFRPPPSPPSYLRAQYHFRIGELSELPRDRPPLQRVYSVTVLAATGEVIGAALGGGRAPEPPSDAKVSATSEPAPISGRTPGWLIAGLGAVGAVVVMAVLKWRGQAANPMSFIVAMTALLGSATAARALDPNEVIPRVAAAFDLDVPPGPYEVKVEDLTGDLAPGQEWEVKAGEYSFRIYPRVGLVSFNARRFPPRLAPGAPRPPARFTRVQIEAKAERALRAVGYGPWFDQGCRVRRHVDAEDPELGETAEATAGLSTLTYGYPPRDGWRVEAGGPTVMISSGDGRVYSAQFFLDREPWRLESLEGIVPPRQAAETALRELRAALARHPQHPQPDVWPTVDELVRTRYQTFAVRPSGTSELGFTRPDFRPGDPLRAQYSFFIGDRRLWSVSVGARSGRVYGAGFAAGPVRPPAEERFSPLASPPASDPAGPSPTESAEASPPPPSQESAPWWLFAGLGAVGAGVVVAVMKMRARA